MNTCMGTIKYLRYGEGRMKWKKLSGELPPEDDYVLLYNSDSRRMFVGFRTVVHAMPNEEPYHPPITEYHDENCREVSTPDFWMPLPNAPIKVPQYRCPYCVS